MNWLSIFSPKKTPRAKSHRRTTVSPPPVPLTEDIVEKWGTLATVKEIVKKDLRDDKRKPVEGAHPAASDR